ncbi:TspO/MBR related protein [Flavobacteriaceae bacterium MAR_2009_75]|nr:TspO/MBR related protein [Flavobacteriaceae bacterium MAR_2009_75]
MKNKFLHIAYAVGICLIIALLSSFVTQSSVNDWYVTLNKPNFTPANWLFAPVWTLLYISMGVAAGIVWNKGFYHLWVKTALYHFCFQLLLNAMWSIVFFGLKELFLALIIIVSLLILIIFTIRWFKVVSKLAAWLLVPYFLWICFATVLTYQIWALN